MYTDSYHRVRSKHERIHFIRTSTPALEVWFTFPKVFGSFEFLGLGCVCLASCSIHTAGLKLRVVKDWLRIDFASERSASLHA